jgi:hypothetical protein
MANRLVRILPKFISPEQTAKGRCITDNGILAQELLHSMNTKGLNSRLMAIKLDMQRAYDRLKWDYLALVCFAKVFFPSVLDK